MRNAGFATLLLDLLTPEEERDRRNVFDIELLATRLTRATQWVAENPSTADLMPCYFGASTGAGAALRAAAVQNSRVTAIVSRGGRPDLAFNVLPLVRAPTLLLVGSLDKDVIEMNRRAYAALTCEKCLIIVQGAGHLFEEPGTLDEVVQQTIAWFRGHLPGPASRADTGGMFLDRREAGRELARALSKFSGSEPLILALPRGGVPVAFEVAKALQAPLDLLMVRKIGAPGHEEFGIGAVVDGNDPQVVLNAEAIDLVDPPTGYVEAETQRQLKEIERRRRLYLGGRHPIPTKGRTVILVDDGIATGGTMRAALKAMRRTGACRLVVAVPVASPDVIEALRHEADEVICLREPTPLSAVGLHYADFRQTTDEEVVRLLNAACDLRNAAAGTVRARRDNRTATIGSGPLGTKP